MNSVPYLKTLKERLSHRFDTFEGERSAALGLDLLATYSLRGEKYMLSKKIQIYALEEYEHCLVRVCPKPVTLQEAQIFAQQVQGAVAALVRPHADHKRTILTGVLVAEAGCENGVPAFIRKYYSQKSFHCMLHGWCEVRLVLADLHTGTVAFCNKRHSRHLGKMYSIPAAE